MRLRILTLSAAALVLAACSQAEKGADAVTDAASDAAETVAEAVTETVEQVKATVSIDEALAMQPDATQARYDARNPGKTLAYFGLEPGMTVVEALPGGGWYSKIMIPVLGDEGTLIGADYSIPMWGKFGGFATEEFLKKKETWGETWVADAKGWPSAENVELNAFAFGSRPESIEGTADLVLFVRAFHHLTRFDRAFLPEALDDVKAVLKPDGIVGIVQHRAPEGNDDGWANGDNGYVKQSEVIKIMEAAGFELVGESEINANPKDVPTNDDFVWRLPPTLGTSRDNPELKAEMEAIGESDRMTLKFKLKS